MMNTNVILAIAFTVIILLFIGGMIFVIYNLYVKRKKKANPIDINVIELTKNGYIARNEIGRFQLHPRKGKMLVTVKRGLSNIFSVKDNLGYSFSEHDCIISSMGKGRKFLTVAMKDGLSSSLNYVENNIDLSEEEKDLLTRIADKGINKVDNLANPMSLSTTPITHEQTRFALDITQDASVMYVDKDRQAARALMRAAITVFSFVVIAVIVIIVILITQGPSMAETLTGSAVKTASGGGLADKVIPS